MEKEQEIPEWLGYELLYEEGEVVKSVASYESYELNALELSIYDIIEGKRLMIEFIGDPLDKRAEPLYKSIAIGLEWFRQNNLEAYSVLLKHHETESTEERPD